MSFIRGIFGICESCSGELSMRSDVKRIGRVEGLLEYQGGCPSCSARFARRIDRDTHLAGIRYMKQSAANKRAALEILEPVSPAEEELFDFSQFLETATDETIWAELHASS